MRVYVVMGNDFPDAVFAKADDAEAYCKREDAKNIPHTQRIHWRFYDFELQDSLTDKMPPPAMVPRK